MKELMGSEMSMVEWRGMISPQLLPVDVIIHLKVGFFIPKDRAITLREAALLQTFPPNYQFCLERGKGHVARQIGNAFPPDMIRPIARIIHRELSV